MGVFHWWLYERISISIGLSNVVSARPKVCFGLPRATRGRQSFFAHLWGLSYCLASFHRCPLQNQRRYALGTSPLGTTYFCREHDQVIHSSAAHERLDDGNSGKPHHRCGSYICRCRDVRGTGFVDGRVKARVRGGGRDVAGRGRAQHVTATHAKQLSCECRRHIADMSPDSDIVAVFLKTG